MYIKLREASIVDSLWRGDLQIIPNAGHLAQWEQPERFNRLLEEFIEEVR
ncbi:MAG: hypothetical protein HZC48_09585 [Nitrospirae bacterium]|nr:hypothetical protein [Nitrospirota bacterium]